MTAWRVITDDFFQVLYACIQPHHTRPHANTDEARPESQSNERCRGISAGG
jgi:hypothetical protein